MPDLFFHGHFRKITHIAKTYERRFRLSKVSTARALLSCERPLRGLFCHRSLNTFHMYCSLLSSESSAMSSLPLEDQPCGVSHINPFLKLIAKSQQSKMKYRAHCNWVLDLLSAVAPILPGVNTGVWVQPHPVYVLEL